ncbi:MAG: hypothetical protein IT424_06235 [Pirellulales bacterium]|nr:hypothetical protein [Pirellulales bacterium]
MDKQQYRVWFTNVTGCAAGISNVSLELSVAAIDEADALERALAEAQAINRRSGLPPHGLRLDESYLRTLACIAPEGAK